jgi:molybdate transport system substrate-binding protein
MRRLVLVLGAIGLLVTGCASTATPSQTSARGLTVFAAASLRSVLEPLTEAWHDAHPEIGLRLAFDGSNVLATQISEGAPADVFISADTTWPDWLAAQDHVAAPPVRLLRNAVTIVTPLTGSSVHAATDLARPGLRIVGTGTGVPITRYAEQAVDRIAATQPDAADFAARVAANVVSREDNVRLALAKVELGEGDAALVYVTDALNSERVAQIPIPGDVAVSAEYAVVQISPRQSAATFIDWLRGPTAAAVFAEAGFEPVAP